MFDKAVILGDKSGPTIEFPVTKYTCCKCGVVFGAKVDKKIDSCILCGNSNLSSEAYNEERPLFFIPFTQSDGDVQNDYKKKVFWNPLVPFAFKRKKNYQNIQKVFLPAFLVNVNHKGNVVFLAGDKQKIVQNGKKCMELKKYEVYHKIFIDYRNVLLNISTKIEDKLFTNLCNYDYAYMKEFTSSDVRDNSYIFGDVPATEMGKKERDRISKYSLLKVRNGIDHSLRKLKSDDTSIEFYDAKEVLVPVYVLTVQYRNKNYQYFMNGQTGQSYIFLPVGIWETILCVILFGGIVFLITYLLLYYL